jgi:hypothetical protein
MGMAGDRPAKEVNDPGGPWREIAWVLHIDAIADNSASQVEVEHDNRNQETRMSPLIVSIRQ